MQVPMADELHPQMMRDLSDVLARFFSTIYERLCKMVEISDTWRKSLEISGTWRKAPSSKKSQKELQSDQPYCSPWDNHGASPLAGHLVKREKI